MLLRELTVHDFRTYGGRQTIQLTPKSRNRPIVLFGGLNGAGKTTLLDALQLVLYGPRARCASRGNLAYKTFLRRSISRRADPAQGASIELCFSYASEGRDREYRVRRSWYATGSGVRENVEVLVDGVEDPVLTEQWAERVDDFAPNRISHLFFFDGEKVAELAKEEGSARILKTAVHSLLGLDLVDRLVNDLGILDRNKRREGEISFNRAKAEQLEAERSHLGSEQEKAAEERASLHNQLDCARSALSEVQALYQGEGGELAEKRTELEGEARALEALQDERREQLRDLTLGALPLVAVTEALAQIDQQAHSEVADQRDRVIAGVLETRDAETLRRMEATGAGAGVLTKLRGILSEQAVSVVQEDASFLDLDPDDVRMLDRLTKAELPGEARQAAALCEELERLGEQIMVLDRKLKSIPEEGELANIRDRREEALALVEGLTAELDSKEERICFLHARYEATQESYKRELEKELSAAQVNDALYRKLDRIRVGSSALDDFRGAVLKRNLGRVEDAVLDSFRSLIRKPNLINRVRIDPEEFSMELFDSGDGSVDREQLSAGELQLLAVATLWGLARTSGLPLPVVIDTPLGRLDSVHRHNFVTRYFPNASHQVLLLSTDKEIEENHVDDLKPFISHSYLLDYEPDEDRTVVREGYFAK